VGSKEGCHLAKFIGIRTKFRQAIGALVIAGEPPFAVFGGDEVRNCSHDQVYALTNFLDGSSTLTWSDPLPSASSSLGSDGDGIRAIFALPKTNRSPLLNCYLTVATADDEQDLTTPEHNHDCAELWAVKKASILEELDVSENPSRDWKYYPSERF
jgi:hypothetical protein